MFPITVLSCTSLLKCLCSRYLSESKRNLKATQTPLNQSQHTPTKHAPIATYVYSYSQLNRTPNHTPTNNEMGVTRKRDVDLTRFTVFTATQQLRWTRQFFLPLYVPPLVTFLIGLYELNSGYRTKHIIRVFYFFERYVRTLTYSILAYPYPRAMVKRSQPTSRSTLASFQMTVVVNTTDDNC